LLVDTNRECLAKVRKVLFGGERVSVEHTRKAFELLPPGTVVHVYGPTEGTVYSTYHIIESIAENIQTVPIGRPVSNTRVYILDRRNNLQPVGVPGELCIAGDGLARGYLNRPDLTRDKFVENPFEKGSLMYRTGDLARWLSDGTIEFIGRIDTQVKIRGYRVELGEIEAQLLKYPEITECVVVAGEDNSINKYLAAYYVSEENIDIARLRKFVNQELPDYMVPAYFVRLEKMPLNKNGKIDRLALPEITMQVDTGSLYRAPATQLEKKLVRIWEEVLELERVGLNDNFFEIGGHSLKANIVTSRIKRELNIEIPLMEFFQNATVEKLAEYISNCTAFGDKSKETIPNDEDINSRTEDSANENGFIDESLLDRYEEIDFTSYNTQAVLDKEIPLTYTQLDHWLMHIDTKDRWPINLVYGLNGNLDVGTLEKAINIALRNHDAFWMHFGRTIPVQKTSRPTGIPINYYDLSNISEDINDKKKVLSETLASKTPVDDLVQFGVKVVKIEPEQYVVFLRFYHIVADGTSVGIFIKEVCQYYNALAEGRKIRIKPAMQLADYIRAERNFLDTDEYEADVRYWKKELDGCKLYKLPVKERVEKSTDDRPVTVSVTESQYKKIIELSAKCGASFQMVMLSLVGKALKEYNGQEDIVVKLVLNERDTLEKQHLIGPIYKEMPVRMCPLDTDIENLVSKVKKSMLESNSHNRCPWIIPMSLIERRKYSKLYTPLFWLGERLSVLLSKTIFKEAKLPEELLSYYAPFVETLRLSWIKKLLGKMKLPVSYETTISLNILLEQSKDVGSFKLGSSELSLYEELEQYSSNEDNKWVKDSLEFSVIGSTGQKGDIIMALSGGHLKPEAKGVILQLLQKQIDNI
ncbi:MAG: AMP-binding protein, partial [Clostridiaceae bacterium]|nr:AMP-binding protein [Clostridiaceae bacterium]